MTEPALWTLSLQAFSAVIVVLALLAAAVRLLTLVFQAPQPAPVAARVAAPIAAAGPERAEGAGEPDAFVVAAIHAAVQRAHPGARVTRVDEVTSEVR